VGWLGGRVRAELEGSGDGGRRWERLRILIFELMDLGG